MKPKSHLSSISDNSCHRCPNCQYNPCQCQCDAQTHFSSVHEDSPSTRFLYVGRSFHGQECDSGREFKDCRSDTEIHQKPSCQVLSTKPSTCVSEYSNYKQMLKQIITMSQKVLERIEKREQQTGGRMSSPPTSCSMSIHVDPVQIAVPVTIHFQRKASPSSNVLPCPSATMQRQQQQQQQPCIQQGYPQTTNNISMPCNIKSEIECECDAPKPLMGICDDAQPPCNAISALPTFPFSAEKRNEVCVSQNKFPQENLPASKSGICDFDMICVAHLHNDPAPEPPCLPICEPVETFDCDISEQPAESLEERDDKAIQTDKRHGRMKGSKENKEQPVPIFVKAENRTDSKADLESTASNENLADIHPGLSAGSDSRPSDENDTKQQDDSESRPAEAKTATNQNNLEPKFRHQAVQTLSYDSMTDEEQGKNAWGLDINKKPSVATQFNSEVEPEDMPEIKTETEAEIEPIEPKVEPIEPKVEPILPPKPPSKVYRLALPQHKDLDLCNKCRFNPSPLFDNDGNAFCPGQCGCCLCPWKALRSVPAAGTHEQVKICKCRERLTIFTQTTNDTLNCSTMSFDMCPCREKAQAKFYEQTSHQMFGEDNKLTAFCFGKEVYLSDVEEIRK